MRDEAELTKDTWLAEDGEGGEGGGMGRII